MNGLRTKMLAPMTPATLSGPPTASSSPDVPAAVAAAAVAGARSPPPTPVNSHLPSPLSLNLLLPPAQQLPPRPPVPEQFQERIGAVGRVRLADILPYDGTPGWEYHRAVEALSGSLTRYNAVVVELGNEDAVVMRCALESARMFFKTRAQCESSGGFGYWGRSGRGFYTYRAGRALEDGDLSPPCMSDAFRCLGKAARAALSAIAKHLRLRSDIFNHLLDDTPLPTNEVSSSLLVATYSHASQQNGRGYLGGGKYSVSEVEKGMLTLIASDHPGVQVCDPNGRWYLADRGSTPSDLLLLTGKALSHATASLRPAALYKIANENSSGSFLGGRASLTFRLMPQANAVLDCSPIAAAGHVIPQSYQPISVSQFMDDLSAEEDVMCNPPDSTWEAQSKLASEPSLRSVLSDPLSGAFLEDAVVVSCGHSFGGHMLKKVLELARCTICTADIETRSLIPNLALRAAAIAVRSEDERRLFHNAALRKRRKEGTEQVDPLNNPGKENGEMTVDGDIVRHVKGVQYPFVENEKVLIKGNRRTPDKFVGKEAVITSQCLNGWYLLKILDSGESVRLQYRSLQKLRKPQDDDSAQPLALLKE
ncbi:U-box domain-containing protein 62 [Apostasia shenzhenica]|uniref:U-box domain-containing protein 62 n=1 Tax=Apostasia shenzhenica TaxID=1088818 RepID=A0A2I0AT55_9ASPA|nr:U-box domain-containing protein 62 [Apostasia shenzhenica]